MPSLMYSPSSLSQPHRVFALVRAAAFAVAVAGLVAGFPIPTQAALRDWLPFGRTHDIAKLLPAVVNIETISYKPDPQDKSALRAGPRPSAPDSSWTRPATS